MDIGIHFIVNVIPILYISSVDRYNVIRNVRSYLNMFELKHDLAYNLLFKYYGRKKNEDEAEEP